MSERVRNIIVGITMLLGVVGVAIMMLLFGYAPAWLDRGYLVTIKMNSASGLAVGSRARMSGTDVGRVTSVQLAEPPNWGVELKAMIKHEVRLPVGLRVSVESPILGGSPALTFQPSPQHDGSMLRTDGRGRIEVKYDVPTLASQFATELRSALQASVSDLKAEFDAAQGKFDALSKTWIEVGRNVNALVEPLSPDAVDGDETGTTLGNLATVLARADARLRQIENVVDGINQWVSDQDLRQHARELLSNTNRMAIKIDGGVDHLMATATSARQTFDGLVGKFIDVAGELSGAVRSLRHVIDQVAKGQGTLGKALHDPVLYHSLNDAAERLGKTLDEIRMLVEKWQTEGLPVKFE